MKIVKTITIDSEINDKLKDEPNASGLISKLLEEYYNEGGAMQEQALEHLINVKKLEINRLKNDIQIIVDKQINLHKMKKILKKALDKVPAEVQEDLEFYPKLTLDALEVRFKEIYSPKYPKLLWDECVEAYNKYHGREN